MRIGKEDLVRLRARKAGLRAEVVPLTTAWRDHFRPPENGDEGCVICTASRRVAQRLLRVGLEPEPAGPVAGSSWRFRVSKYALRVKVGRRAVPLAGRVRTEGAAQGPPGRG